MNKKYNLEKYYVYLLRDPLKKDEVFYVGKDNGERFLQHLKDVENQISVKSKKIRNILAKRKKVKVDILRHNLKEEEAFYIESIAIDLIGRKNLTNVVRGHYSQIKKIDEFLPESLTDVEHDLILININKLYKRGMSKKDLYEATRASWVISLKSVENIKYVCSVYRGIIKGVFIIDKWKIIESNIKEFKGYNRKGFDGKPASKKIWDKYYNKDVSKYWPKGSQNPIKYVKKEF